MTGNDDHDDEIRTGFIEKAVAVILVYNCLYCLHAIAVTADAMIYESMIIFQDRLVDMALTQAVVYKVYIPTVT